jgi:hypothetical protein
MLEVRAYVSERGMKSFELASLFGKIERELDEPGVKITRVPRSEIDFYTAPLLSAEQRSRWCRPRTRGTHAPQGRRGHQTVSLAFDLWRSGTYRGSRFVSSYSNMHQSS